MSLPPILYHIFKSPLPYLPTLRLQNAIHALQLASRRTNPRSHADYLLLLQHTPVYTAGRRQRQTEHSLAHERERLTKLGADFVATERGGQMTYHGPGQLVGYPLLDLGRSVPPVTVREYVCRLQTTLKRLLADRHGIEPDAGALGGETGVFVDGGRTKLASIGVQVRHRLTTHGVAVNVGTEPLAWFDKIVACGLEGVKAGCIEGRSRRAVGGVEEEARALVGVFGDAFGREMVPLTGFRACDGDAEMETGAEVNEVKALVEGMEEVSRRAKGDD